MISNIIIWCTAHSITIEIIYVIIEYLPITLQVHGTKISTMCSSSARSYRSRILYPTVLIVPVTRVKINLDLKPYTLGVCFADCGE